MMVMADDGNDAPRSQVEDWEPGLAGISNGKERVLV